MLWEGEGISSDEKEKLLNFKFHKLSFTSLSFVQLLMEKDPFIFTKLTKNLRN